MIEQTLAMIMQCETMNPEWTCLTDYETVRQEVQTFKSSLENLKFLREEKLKRKIGSDNQVFAQLIMVDDKWKLYPAIKAEVEAHLHLDHNA